MAPKTVLITGATRGIGYETAKVFLQSPNSYHIFLGARSLKSGSESLAKLKSECPAAANTIEVLLIDVESDESIDKAVESVKKSKNGLDFLINNAGAAFDWDYSSGKTTLRASFTRAYDINVSGAHVVTYQFIPLLLQSSDPRVLFIAGLSQMTAAAESFFPTPPQPKGWPKQIEFETIGYRCSKTALSMLMLDWKFKLEQDGVKVFSVSPGFCVTGLGNQGEDAIRRMGADRHPRDGAKTILSVAEGHRDGDIGKIIGEDGFVPW